MTDQKGTYRCTCGHTFTRVHRGGVLGWEECPVCHDTAGLVLTSLEDVHRPEWSIGLVRAEWRDGTTALSVTHAEATVLFEQFRGELLPVIVRYMTVVHGVPKRATWTGCTEVFSYADVAA